MSASMPEQPKFVQLDPKWKVKGFHATTTVTWKKFVAMLRATGRINEKDKVAAVYVYKRGIMLDLR